MNNTDLIDEERLADFQDQLMDKYLVNGTVFDISAFKASGDPLTPAKFADLSAALGTNGANIPQKIRRGGMSVKFVQSSDNKYVRYNLLATSFTTDTTQWAIAEEGVYVDNPEFIYVNTDAENKILWAIRTDGSIYYGAGVPPQIIDYINEKIAELSLDEYEDIVSFLADLEKEDKTLQELLNEKVDKEEGKSLIDEQYAEGVSHIESPEYIDVKTDKDNKILEAFDINGKKFLALPTNQDDMKQDILVSGINIKTINGKSILGDGDLEVASIPDATISKTSNNAVRNSAIALALEGKQDVGDYPTNSSMNSAIATQIDNAVMENRNIANSAITAEKLTPELYEALSGGSPVTITNNPDNVTIEVSGNALKIKDTNSTAYTYGYKLIAEDTTLTQAIADSWLNCIVDIRAKISLSTNVTMNSTTILLFNGGCIKGSDGVTLSGNNALVFGKPYQIFYDVEFNDNSKFNSYEAYPEWFGAIGDGTTFCSDAFCDLKYVQPQIIRLKKGSTYIVNHFIGIPAGCKLIGYGATLKRYPVFVDMVIYNKEYTEIDDYTLSVKVNPMHPDFAKLRVGMGVSFGDTEGTGDPHQTEFDEGNTRWIKSISPDGTIVLTGIVKVYPVIFNNYQSISMTSGYSILWLDGSNITIEGVTIEGGLTDYPRNSRVYWNTCMSIDISYHSVRNDSDYNILSHNVFEDITIQHCFINNSVADAVCGPAKNLLVSHNMIKHSGANGVHIGAPGSYGCIVENNVIYDSNVNMQVLHNEGGITYSNLVANFLIKSNIFDTCNTGIGGINSIDNDQTTLIDNVFVNFRNHGIWMQNGGRPSWFAPYQVDDVYRNFIISGNRFIGNQQTGYDMYQRNCYESTYGGVPLGATTPASGYAIIIENNNSPEVDTNNWENFVISNNTFYDCGIFAWRINTGTISNNVFNCCYNRDTDIDEVIDVKKSKLSVSNNAFKATAENLDGLISIDSGSSALIALNTKVSDIPFFTTDSDRNAYTELSNINL